MNTLLPPHNLVYVVDQSTVCSLVKLVKELDEKVTFLIDEKRAKPELKDGLIRPKDIAKYVGVSVANIYGNCRFWLPRFGDCPELCWTKEEVLDHVNKGRIKLKQEYEEYLKAKNITKIVRSASGIELKNAVNQIKGEIYEKEN